MQWSRYSCLWRLAAGTDGRDDPTVSVCALVDGAAVTRGKQEESNALLALARAHTATFPAESGEVLDAGSPGTKVNDVVIGLNVHAVDEVPSGG